jgi:hypothetical protein
MTTGYYLLDHRNPNAGRFGGFWGYSTMSQTPRVIVAHTTESLADLNGPDSGAENVANWFATNDTVASYHTLVDSDSTVRCLPAGLDGTTPHTAFHAAGCNSFSLGLSMAVQAHTWPELPALWVVRVLDRAAAEAALWCTRWDIPPVLITMDQAANGTKGILGHGMWDPGSRSDPGAGFPWADFLDRVRRGAQPTTQGDDDMPTHLTTLDGSWWGCFAGLYRPLSGPELTFYQSKGVPTVTHSAAEIATLQDWKRFA